MSYGDGKRRLCESCNYAISNMFNGVGLSGFTCRLWRGHGRIEQHLKQQFQLLVIIQFVQRLKLLQFQLKFQLVEFIQLIYGQP